MKFDFPYTARQKLLMEAPERIVWCGAGTKTGKSMALYCWLIEGLLNGEAGAFCGPWFFRSKAAFDSMKVLLKPFLISRAVRINEARLQFTMVNGGFIDFVSADNPNALFGANYHRLVLDEASRMKESIHSAALTTISATNGRLRLAFNLELGQRNWAVKNLLRVQKLSEEERRKSSETYMTFPTGGGDDGLVDPDLIATLKSQMPLALWEALYLGIIPTSDCSLFRNLDAVFCGKELEAPVED